MKKRLLIENDIPELSDFQKLLLLNKGKLDYEDVEFIDEDGENYPNIIEVTNDGLLFNFDDLGNCWLEDVEDFKFPEKIYFQFLFQNIQNFKYIKKIR
jgi:hypothetical protein